ncbi:hypothetical protein BDQ17DRAFT_1330252 [Cyathus striatus]|nr:hypothetical protein BDQ17DRAFT_1330252 [Cyathus striatus]
MIHIVNCLFNTAECCNNIPRLSVSKIDTSILRRVCSDPSLYKVATLSNRSSTLTSTFAWFAEAGAALAFLIGYSFIYLWMLYAYLTHRIKWRSRYSLLFFHVTIRVASQACGVAFGVLGFANKNVFIAYLILGAEGYFTLVLCAFRFLVSWHEHNLPSHESWLEPPKEKLSKDEKLRKFSSNTAIVVGGSYLAGADYNNPNSSDTRMRLNVAKISRTAGQSVFLFCNVGLLVAILITIGGERKRRRVVHPTLLILLIAWFPLIVRVFRVLQSAVWSLSYYNGVLTEWLACLLLNTTYFTSKGDPSKHDKQKDIPMEVDNL